jgi:hypothetical protein
MIAGYPVPIRQVWDHRIAMLTPILVQTTDIGLARHRHRLMLSMVSLPVSALPRMTISILSRRSQKAGLSGHHRPSSRNGWEMFTLVLSSAVIATNRT